LTATLVDSAVAITVTKALTLGEIKQRVRKRYPQAVDFSADRLAARLMARGFSFKRCRLSLKKRPAAEFADQKVVLEHLKRDAKAERVRLFFLDESGISIVPNVWRACLPLGKPHCADACVTRNRVNILGAPDYAANTLIPALRETSVKRVQVVDFIDQLATRHDDGAPMAVVLDNASIHLFYRRRESLGVVRSEADAPSPACLQSQIEPHRNSLATGQISVAEISRLDKATTASRSR
jgi:hypothetical protein